MNILILTTHLNPGGISRYVLNLSKGLIKEGHSVWVASSGGSWVGILELLDKIEADDKGVSLFLKVPYISVYHGFYRPGFFRKFFPFRGNLSIAVSKKVKRHLIRDLSAKENKIRVVYNGVDLDEFSPGPKQKESHGFPAKDFLIGILGRVSEEKGHFLEIILFV